jgi:hypothetical protein
VQLLSDRDEIAQLPEFYVRMISAALPRHGLDVLEIGWSYVPSRVTFFSQRVAPWISRSRAEADAHRLAVGSFWYLTCVRDAADIAP